jgi:cobalt-zinc-cadmium efflux system outer membrane protein
MRHSKRWTFALVASALVASGCAKLEKSPGFTDVQQMAGEKGVSRIVWNQGTAEDEAVSQWVGQMLSDDLTPEEAVQIALINNRALQSVYEDLRIAQGDLVRAGLIKNPVFDGSIRFVESGGGEILDLGIAFDFLDIFYIPMRKALAKEEFEVAKLKVTGEVIDLAGKTKVAVYELQAAEQVLEVRQTALAAYEASYDFAKRLRAAGNFSKLRFASENVDYEQARLDVMAAGERVATLREKLNVLMGLYGQRVNWKIGSRLPEVPDQAVSSDRLESLAIERSIDLKQAYGEILVAARRLGISGGEGLFSDIEVGASAEREPDGEWSVGPSLELQLPVFSQGQAEVAKSDAGLRQAISRHHATAVLVRAEVRTAYVKAQAARQRAIHLRDRIVPLRQVILLETQKQFNGMFVGVFDLLEAKREQVEAARQYIEAVRDYWIARAELEQIVGGRLVRGGLYAPAGESSSKVSSSKGDH